MTWKNGQYQPKQKRADEKKRRILDAALELFGTQGFNGTTSKEIAAKAGVATGTFYRYFRDKKVAFLAVCLRFEEDFGGRLFEFGKQMRREGRSERDVVNSLISFSVAAHRRNRDFHREVLAMQIVDPDVAAWTRDREKRVMAALSEFLRPMSSSYRIQDVEAAAELLYYVIEEVSHRVVLFESPAGETRLVRHLQDMVSRYLFA